MKDLRVQLNTNAEGRIVGWYEVDEGGYILPSKELQRFSACSGNCYRVEGDTLVFDETLEVIELPTPVDQITALELAVTELYERVVQ